MPTKHFSVCNTVCNHDHVAPSMLFRMFSLRGSPSNEANIWWWCGCCTGVCNTWSCPDKPEAQEPSTSSAHACSTPSKLPLHAFAMRRYWASALSWRGLSVTHATAFQQQRHWSADSAASGVQQLPEQDVLASLIGGVVSALLGRAWATS